MRTEIKGLLLLLLFSSQTLIAATEKGSGEETHEFQAEVGRLMDIIINSLYTEKQIFLRELISNASDALDKIRFMAIQDPEIMKSNSAMEISILYDKDNKILELSDTGIGMTKADMISNLGTIAKSGTSNFMEAIKGGDINIIGQFGVGFYSAFLVAQKVEVISKNNDDLQHIWSSSAANSYSIKLDEEHEDLKRGTRIRLHLKQDAEDYLDEKNLKDLVKKYSEFINFPIKLRCQKEVEKEVEEEEEEAKEPVKDGEEKSDDDLEVKDAEEDKPKEKKTKKIKEKVWEYDVVNDNKAIWMKSKEDIEDEEYKKFYKSLTKDYDDPMSWIHFKAEGEVEFTSLLFVAKRAAHDLYENYYGKSAALKLYVRRVLINEEFDDLIPRYLNFVRGVVDSDELPINVSRDNIQQVKQLKVIGRKLVRKTLEMIRKMAEAEDLDETDSDEDEDEETADGENRNKAEKEEEDQDDDQETEEDKEKRKQIKKDKYKEFWKEFGKNIKLGIIEDQNNRAKLAELTRWYTSENTTEYSSLQQYIDRAKEKHPNQDSIYFLAGESKDAIMKQPVLQKLLKKGYEVVLCDDPIDEFVFQHLTEFEKKKVQNVGRGDFKMPGDDDNERKRNKKLKKLYKPLTDWWKKQLSKADVEEVSISEKLIDDPVVVVGADHGQSPYMEKISKAQAYANKERGNPYANTKRKVEINPSHPAIKELFERVKDDPDSETEELAQVLFEGALINSGYVLSDTHDFSKRFYRLFNGALGIPRNAPVEEVQVDLDEEDEDDDKKKDESENLDDQNESDDDKEEEPKDDL